MSQPQKSQQSGESGSVIDRARSRTAKAGEASSSKRASAKKPKTAKANAKAGFSSSDLPARYDEKEIERRQAEFEANGPVTTVTRDAWEGVIEQRRDDPDRAPDPNEEAVEAIREPGKTYRILSPRVMQKRGRRNWEIVRDKDGKPVEVPGSGNLIGSMPIDAAIRRNKKYQQEGLDAVANANEQFNETADQLEHESKGTVSILRRGDVIKDNDPRKRGIGGGAVIGSESFRG